MDFTGIISIIQQLGFPMFVSIYLLVGMDKRLREIRDELKKMNGRR